MILFMAAAPVGLHAEEPESLPVYTASAALDFWGTEPSRPVLVRLAKDAEARAIGQCAADGHLSCALAEITRMECESIQSQRIEGTRCTAYATAAPL
jgi:hypothetical protein